MAWLQFTPATQPDNVGGTHVIVSQQNGIAVDNDSSRGSGQGTTAGVIRWGLNNGQAQRWSFTPNSDGTWNIISQYSWQALDDGNTAANGAQIVQWPWTRGPNQRWWVDQQPDGSYRIWNQASGGVLDNSSSSQNGYPLVQWGWNGGPQQRWGLQ